MPLVSIVTPVYNGDAYLAECIESVLSQTFSDWELVVVDNCSSDRTRSIAEAYATRDSRIRVVGNDKTLPVIANFNRGGRLASPQAKYLKFLCADDVLFETCVERMVAVAELNPSVQIVGSYKIHGLEPVCDGPPYPEQVLDGREVCRRFFRGALGFLGSPTDHLIRMPAPTQGGALFDEEFLHADIELWVRMLKDGAAYGFVHQVLTFTRVHEGAVSSFAHVMGTGVVEFVAMLERYGHAFYTDHEHRAVLRGYRRRYAGFLARSLAKVWDRRIWSFQADSRRKLGVNIGGLEVVSGGLREAVAAVVSPSGAVRRLSRERARRVALGKRNQS